MQQKKNIIKKSSPRPSGDRAEKPKTGLYLYGRHAVEAALANPQRKIKRLLVSDRSNLPKEAASYYKAEIVAPNDLARLLPENAVHQGIVAEVSPLPDGNLDDAIATNRPVLLLDQVTDPQNVGAILRSAAAFDAACVVLPKHNSPDESGTLARAACGALDIVPVIRVPNLVQAIEYLKKNGYWCAGLDGHATQTIAEAKLTGKTALVLGAEGKGLRRLTGENCDFLVKLPISEKMESLNVSNAAAIALYELSRS